jgi:hypothetical protein
VRRVVKICNINAIFKKNEQNIDIVGFIQAVSSHSFAHNNHGEGVFFSSNNSVYKSKEKIDYNKLFEEKFDNSKVIITHQRFSTSGFEVKYNHPFFNDDFVLVHNGVINQFLNGSGSDTSGFFKAFVKSFNKIDYRHISRQQKIVKVIRDLFEDDKGTYSILIYDKRTKQSYYFRNYPSIHFYKNKDFLFITTESDNKIFLPMISDKEFIELEIKSREIYHINEKAEVYKIGELPEQKITIVDEDEEEKEKEDENDEDEIKRVSFKDKNSKWFREDDEGEYSPEDINSEIARQNSFGEVY